MPMKYNKKYYVNFYVLHIIVWGKRLKHMVKTLPKQSPLSQNNGIKQKK